MPRLEISKEEFESLKDKYQCEITEFVRNKMGMEDIVRGTRLEHIEEEDGKFFACWESCNYRLD